MDRGDRLAGRSLHDLQNKVASILINVEYLLDDSRRIGPEELREVLLDVQAAAKAIRAELAGVAGSGPEPAPP